VVESAQGVITLDVHNLAELQNVDEFRAIQIHYAQLLRDCVAVCCSLLQYNVVCCSILQCVAELENVNELSTTQIHHAQFLRDCIAVCCSVV